MAEIHVVSFMVGVIAGAAAVMLVVFGYIEGRREADGSIDVSGSE